MWSSLCRNDNGELFCKKISICEVRPLIKNTPLGTSFYDLKRGLKRLGINSTISQATKKEEVFKETSYPCITQITNDQGIHFVILFEEKNSRLIMGDSSSTKQKSISIKKFMSNWIPYVLQVDIGSSEVVYEIEQSAKEIGMFRIAGLVKWELLVSFIISILVYILGIIIANLYTLYFNILIPQNLPSRFNFPPIFIKQPKSAEIKISAPVDKISLVFSATIISEISGALTENVPPKPQQFSK